MFRRAFADVCRHALDKLDATLQKMAGANISRGVPDKGVDVQKPGHVRAGETNGLASP